MAPTCEALERMRAANAKWDEDYETNRRNDDAMELARELVHLADDAPADKEWLLSIGAGIDFSNRQRTSLSYYDKKYAHFRAFVYSDGRINISLWGFGSENHAQLVSPTRGQFRTICRGLGIQLAETLH